MLGCVLASGVKQVATQLVEGNSSILFASGEVNQYFGLAAFRMHRVSNPWQLTAWDFDQCKLR